VSSLPTDLETALDADRKVAEGLQDRLRRDHQTAAALREYLVDHVDAEHA
jgi:hypothetical protein